MRFRRVLFVGLSLAFACIGEVYSQEADTAGYQDLPMTSSGDLTFFLDTAGFRGPQGHTREEIYVLIDAGQLKFRRENKQSVARLELSVKVVSEAGETAAEETWERTVSVEDEEDIGSSSLPFNDVIGFDLKPGMYQISLTIRDLNGKLSGTSEAAIQVHNFEGKNLTTSNILFASALEQTNREGRFAKRGWNVIPNTTRSYMVGNEIPIYFEVYNLAAVEEGADNTFIVGYSLTDTSGKVVASYPPKRLAKPGDSVVKTEQLPIGDLPGGGYDLQVEVLDRRSREVARTRRKVFLAPENMPVELTEDQKDQLRYYMDIQYVASSKERKVYNDLESQEAKMRFLRNFWKEQDPTAATPENERLIEHMQRMRHADNNYAAGRGKRGADTDKGRIYVKYGAPTDIQYNMASAQEKPFEVWTYERTGGYRFIFQDRRGAGVFELVHSTHPKEFYNPQWRMIE